MRQFDVLVWGTQTGRQTETRTPPFTDRALGWFFGNDLDAGLRESDAEWIVLAHESVVIDRAFLNSLAECIEGYPMVDAFAPRVKVPERNTFISGFRLDKRCGLSMLDENAELRFVSAANPVLAAFSRRIIQRTGVPDKSLPVELQVTDMAFRMLHAGGKMLSVPYLVTTSTSDGSVSERMLQQQGELAYTLTKSFGVFRNAGYLARHPKAAYFIWKNRKELFEKRDKAILLSKLEKDYLKSLF